MDESTAAARIAALETELLETQNLLRIERRLTQSLQEQVRQLLVLTTNNATNSLTPAANPSDNNAMTSTTDLLSTAVSMPNLGVAASADEMENQQSKVDAPPLPPKKRKNAPSSPAQERAMPTADEPRMTSIGGSGSSRKLSTATVSLSNIPLLTTSEPQPTAPPLPARRTNSTIISRSNAAAAATSRKLPLAPSIEEEQSNNKNAALNGVTGDRPNSPPLSGLLERHSSQSDCVTSKSSAGDETVPAHVSGPTSTCDSYDSVSDVVMAVSLVGSGQSGTVPLDSNHDDTDAKRKPNLPEKTGLLKHTTSDVHDMMSADSDLDEDGMIGPTKVTVLRRRSSSAERMSGRDAHFNELFEMSTQLKGFVRDALEKKYNPDGTRNLDASATVIQTHYRQYKLKTRFKEIVNVSSTMRARGTSIIRRNTRSNSSRAESLSSSESTDSLKTGRPRHESLQKQAYVNALAAQTAVSVSTTTTTTAVPGAPVKRTLSRLSAQSGKDSMLSAMRNRAEHLSHDPITLMHQSVSVDSGVSEVSKDDMLITPPLLQSQASDNHRLSRLLRLAIARFNRDPKKGMKYMIQNNIVGGTPQEVAKFLLETKGLSKKMIGDYLGEGDEFNVEVMEHFMDSIEFKGEGLDTVLRHYLSFFRLPGEAQKISRMMENFARKYCENCPNEFKNSDTAFILAFSVVMLNTDLHNPSVKNRMTLEDFLRNNRGIDNGQNLPREMLEGIYNRIANDQILPGEDHTLEVERITKSVVGNYPDLAQPHRVFIRMINAVEIVDMEKQTPKGKHLRTLYLFNDVLLVTKPVVKKVEREANSKTLSAVFITQFMLRMLVPLLGMKIRHHGKSKYHENSFEFLDMQGTTVIALKTKTAQEKEGLLDDLREQIADVTQLETERLGNMRDIVVRMDRTGHVNPVVAGEEEEDHRGSRRSKKNRVPMLTGAGGRSPKPSPKAFGRVGESGDTIGSSNSLSTMGGGDTSSMVSSYSPPMLSPAQRAASTPIFTDSPVLVMRNVSGQDTDLDPSRQASAAPAFQLFKFEEKPGQDKEATDTEV